MGICSNIQAPVFNNTFRAHVVRYIPDTQELLLAIEFKMEKGWYIRDHSDSAIGTPLNIRSVGAAVQKVFYPESVEEIEMLADQEIKYGGFYAHNYIAVLLTKPKNQFLISVVGGMCSDICIPVKCNISLHLDTSKYFVDEGILYKITGIMNQ
ncbi:MAG: hypothetical protein P857_1115 [Candidatus Xenolissoclinum pacificiensis L6]|uniref:Thiol:disulfide interchange protein DsbD N-terminal domain-containing protein n=1 Tax=Candidatus Xenolissoclinum pacificiensis L6 TaxID=1401685 RepID=W2V1D7_9RICK|nr:MAG: hypothetical protein P857_1115 [Candidatus Xenolissoclinum pacificiensis L6]